MYKNDYDFIIAGIDNAHYYDSHSGCMEIAGRVGNVIISSPAVVNELVGDGIPGVSGMWLLSFETPLGDFIEPQQSVATSDYARALVIEWLERTER
jgi:hypothetical protein